MKGALLGPEYSDQDIRRTARQYKAPYQEYNDFNNLCKDVSHLISEGNVVGWFQGRMEYGPRALGNRSILGDPRQPDMQKRLNLKIKYREGFRPFAPSVLEECNSEFLKLSDLHHICCSLHSCRPVDVVPCRTTTLPCLSTTGSTTSSTTSVRTFIP